MASYPQAASDYLKAKSAISGLTVMGVRRLWGMLGPGDFDASWAELSPRVLALMAAGQLATANAAAAYVPAVLADQGLLDAPLALVNPRSVVGVAGSGMPLSAVLSSPVIAVKTKLAAGASMSEAQQSGGDLLDRITTTQLGDAGRSMESVATVVRPAITGYIRHLLLPSCKRCAILAGRFYRWSSGFSRHPTCDCFHVPTTEKIADDLTTDPLGAIRAGKVHGLSEADRNAIVEDGADPNQVINAARGMSTGQVYGKRAKVTTTGAGKGQIRLRPETIYKLAGDDRIEAVRLLHQFGYLL